MPRAVYRVPQLFSRRWRWMAALARIPLARRPRGVPTRAGRPDGQLRIVNSRVLRGRLREGPTGEGHCASSAYGRKDPAGARNEPHGSALLCCARRAARKPGTMLRLPRAAHYAICDLLCARDLARLSETASQWSRADDPRHAAFFACLADRVARVVFPRPLRRSFHQTRQFARAEQVTDRIVSCSRQAEHDCPVFAQPAVRSA